MIFIVQFFNQLLESPAWKRCYAYSD